MKIFLRLALCLATIPAFGQLTVTINDTAASLAHRLSGNGIAISNAVLNCKTGASGTFVYSGSNLGISSGILLTTGSADSVMNPGQFQASVQNNNPYTDPNLTAIDAQATKDVCILEFDVVPAYNNFSLTFVFGSEEYPEFVASGFNDVFGFFLTGPNPNGGNYNGANIGVLPNSVPVSINNVNASNNPAYFHDNYTAPNTDIAYDGYTIPITSAVAVTSGATYHLKIGIADAGDMIYDSGIFIRDSILSSCTTPPNVTLTTLGFADTLCSDAGTQALTGGLPAGGTYYGTGVTGTSFDPMTAGAGTHSIVYIATDSSGCAGSASHDIFIQSCTTGMNAPIHSSRLALQPNPCQDVLQINAPLLQEGRVEIYNGMNQLVRAGDLSQNIDVSALSSGLYFIRIFDGASNILSGKFVKD